MLYKCGFFGGGGGLGNNYYQKTFDKDSITVICFVKIMYSI